MKATLPLFILLLSCCFIHLNAQKTQTVYVNAGMALHAVQDQGHSPLMYAGSGLMYGAAYRSQSDDRFSGVDFSVGKAGLEARLDPESAFGLNTASRSTARGAYYHLRKLPVEAIDIFVGGEAAGFYDFVPYSHNANNLVGYELAFSLSPMVRLEYGISDRLRLAFQASSPLVSYSVRPLENGLFPLEDFSISVAGIIENGQFASVDKLVQLNTRTTLSITSKKDRRVNLFYAYAGGVNQVMARKGFATQAFGIEMPIGLNH